MDDLKQIRLGDYRALIHKKYILGRTWFSKKLCSSWNHITSITLQDFNRILSEIPVTSDFIFEFGSNSSPTKKNAKDHKTYRIKDYVNLAPYQQKIYNFYGNAKQIQDFLTKKTVVQPSQPTDALKQLHTLDPAIKGKVMKDRNIQPKEPVAWDQKKLREGD
jgi:hypothetical protein